MNTNLPSQFIEESTKLGSLGDACIRLGNLSLEISSCSFERAKDGRKWVVSPKNFVTFIIQHTRAKSIALSLRGNPDEYANFSSIKIKAGQNGYSETKIEALHQVGDAEKCICRAWEIYQSRTR
jgi:hypothetical protein